MTRLLRSFEESIHFAESIVTGMTVPHEIAADHFTGSANTAPAMHTGGMARLGRSIELIEDPVYGLQIGWLPVTPGSITDPNSASQRLTAKTPPHVAPLGLRQSLAPSHRCHL